MCNRRLLPLINERDVLAMVSSTLAKELADVTKSLSATEIECMQLATKNQDLSQTMLSLAEEASTKTVKDVDDASIRGQLQDLDAQIRSARRDWRIMKSVVSGVIAGSGINWATDEKLRDLVLDDEDEIG